MAMLFYFREVAYSVIEGYTTVKAIAEMWNLKPRTVQIMCADGKIPGAVKFGRDWAVPVDAKRPEDKRVNTGEYRNYRKNSSENKVS